MIRLAPLPKGLLDPELESSLERALEYEGWREAETLYGQIELQLASQSPEIRARLYMDQAKVLRRLGKQDLGEAKEKAAELLLGQPIERELEAPSSVDALKEQERTNKKGFLGRFFGS